MDNNNHEDRLRAAAATSLAADERAMLDARALSLYYDPEIRAAMEREQLRKATRSTMALTLILIVVGAVTAALSSPAMGFALVGVLSAAIVFAGVLAGIGDDAYREVLPEQFVICLLLTIGCAAAVLWIT